jgi:hypothetical protein
MTSGRLLRAKPAIPRAGHLPAMAPMPAHPHPHDPPPCSCPNAEPSRPRNDLPDQNYRPQNLRTSPSAAVAAPKDAMSGTEARLTRLAISFVLD